MNGNFARIFAFLLILAGLVAPAEAKRVALVVGNSAYKHATTLKNPKNDADSLSAVLERLDFEVYKGTDLDRARFEGTVRDFARAIRGADVALFFYAGHGLQVNGRNYLAPVDARLADEADLEFETLRLETILAQMERETETSLVFLDACRNNPLARNLARSMGTRSASVGRGLARVDTGIGTLIAFATEPGNVALDGAGDNSPFTTALLSHIEKPGLDIAQLMRRVRLDVMNSTARRQVPWNNSSLTGDFFFVPKREAGGGKPDTAATSDFDSGPDTRSAEVVFWDSIKNSEHVEDYRSYLERFPNGLFSTIAKRRIDRLGTKSQAMLTPPAGERDDRPGPSRSVPVHECDRLAAHSADPHKVVSGVAFDEIDTFRAIAACKEAKKSNPEEKRFAFQLARAQHAAKEYQAALGGYRELADDGYAPAMANLGSLYDVGTGVSEDNAQAVKWFRKAAEAGQANAMFGLGLMYTKGEGVAKDYDESMKWFRKAAAKGEANAMNQIGVMYDNGTGVPKDEREAVKWLKRAAEADNKEAMANLGNMYIYGKGVAKDDREGFNWYRRAAERGHPRAMSNLAYMYENGRGIAKDYGEAFRYYKKAADKGYSLAMANLGVMYEYGRGVGKDPREAVRLYRKAAERGNARGMNNLGIMYREGKGTGKDYREAVKWFYKAADLKFNEAYYSLAHVHILGLGVAKDERIAAKYMFNAIESGNALSVKEMNTNANAWGLAFRKELQRLMRDRGVYTGALDGQFGPGTKRAIEELSPN